MSQKWIKINWRYVIGETLMIVLGILIALYINNLNASRKARDSEQKIINEIESSLSSDLTYHVRGRIRRGQHIANSAEVVLNFLDGQSTYHDSLQRYFWKLNWVIEFEPKTAAFETLKLRGLGTLHDDALRIQLMRMFDYHYPSMQFIVELFNDWTRDHMTPYCLKHFRFNNSRGKAYEPIDIDQLSSSVEFYNLVFEKYHQTKSIIERLEQLEKRMEELSTLIKTQD